MPSHAAPNIGEKAVSADQSVSVDFGGKLKGATISTLTSWTSTAGLTLSSKQITTAIKEINNRQVPIGEALQCLATGGVAGTVYTLTAIVVASDGQTLVGTTRVRVVAD